jgi:hypothetical protein
VPEEIISGFELAADIVAKNGTPIAAADAAPPKN